MEWCSSVQSLSHVWVIASPWTAAHQASLFITDYWSLLKLISIESVMSSNHLILCPPFFLLLSIFLSIRVFSNESVLCITWPKCWSFSFSISSSSEYSGLISFRNEWFDLLAVQGTEESFPTPQFKSINSSALSFLYSPTLTGPKHKLPITSLPSPGRLHLNLPADIHHLTCPFLSPVPFLEPGQ